MDSSSKWTSWNGRISRPYTSLIHVTTEKELADAISDSKNIRVVGAGRSSSDICAGTSHLVDQSRFSAFGGIDENGVATVEPGMLLSDLLARLAEEGRCIPCLPDIDSITIGGAIATGSHGTGRNGRSLSDYVHSCRLVRANGKVEDIGPGHPELDAVRVSMGLFGAFSQIRLRTEPLWTLAVEERAVRDSEWTSEWRAWFDQYDFLRVLWLPHTGFGWVIRGNRYEGDPPFSPLPPPRWNDNRRKISARLYKDSWRNPWKTVLANRVLKWLFFSGTVRQVGTLYDATVTKSRGSTLELAEWTIPFDRFDACFRQLRDRLGRFCTQERAHVPMDVRFIRKTTAWLGNACEADTVTVGCVSRTPERAGHYAAFIAMEQTFLAHGGRPHWAKHFEADKETLRILYPRWDEFLEMRRRYDPSGKFLNDWLRSRFE